MPEGDTIFRTARTLQRALAGRTVTGFESPLPAVPEIVSGLQSAVSRRVTANCQPLTANCQLLTANC